MGSGSGPVASERLFSRVPVRAALYDESPVAANASGLCGNVSSVINVSDRPSFREKTLTNNDLTNNEQSEPAAVTAQNDLPIATTNQHPPPSPADREEAKLLGGLLSLVIERYNTHHSRDKTNKLSPGLKQLERDIKNAVRNGKPEELLNLANERLLRLINSNSSTLKNAFEFVLTHGCTNVSTQQTYTFEKYVLKGGAGSNLYLTRKPVSSPAANIVMVRQQTPESTVVTPPPDSPAPFDAETAKVELLQELNHYVTERRSHKAKFTQDVEQHPDLERVFSIEKAGKERTVTYKNGEAPATPGDFDKILAVLEHIHNTEKSPLIERLHVLYLKHPHTAYAQKVSEERRQAKDVLKDEAILHAQKQRYTGPVTLFRQCVDGEKAEDWQNSKKKFKTSVLKSAAETAPLEVGESDIEEYASYLLGIKPLSKEAKKDASQLGKAGKKKMSPLARTLWGDIKAKYLGTESVVIATTDFLKRQTNVINDYTSHVHNTLEGIINPSVAIRKMQVKGNIAVNRAHDHFAKNNDTGLDNPFAQGRMSQASVDAISTTCYQTNSEVIVLIAQHYNDSFTGAFIGAIYDFDMANAQFNSRNNAAVKENESIVLAKWFSTLSDALCRHGCLQRALLREVEEVIEHYPETQKAAVQASIKEINEANNNKAVEALGKMLEDSLNNAFGPSFFQQELTQTPSTGLAGLMTFFGAVSSKVQRGQNAIDKLRQYEKIIDEACRLIAQNCRENNIPVEEIKVRLGAFKKLIEGQRDILRMAYDQLPPRQSAWERFISSFTPLSRRITIVVFFTSIGALAAGILLSPIALLASVAGGLVTFGVIVLPGVFGVLGVKYLSAKEKHKQIEKMHDDFEILKSRIRPDWTFKDEQSVITDDDQRDERYHRIREAFRHGVYQREPVTEEEVTELLEPVTLQTIEVKPPQPLPAVISQDTEVS